MRPELPRRTVALTGALAATLLVSACDPGPAPGCDAPATVERLLAHTFASLATMGIQDGGPRPVVDAAAGIILSGPDTARFTVRGDTLYVSERGGEPQAVMVALSTRQLYEDAEAGAWECEAVVDARRGMTIPVRYTSARDGQGEHVVRGALRGATGEVLF